MKLLIYSALLLSLLQAAVLAKPSGASDATKPNIIYILADDLGYGDLGCYGQTQFETPNIDQLAKNGMLFTQHYSGSAVCAPARCALMTGLHTGHTPVRGNQNDPDTEEGQSPMPADTYTLAHHLQAAGYQTGIFGKWGLGSPESVSEPLKMGFDRFYGYNCQLIAHCYYPAFLWDNDQRQILWGNVASKSDDYAPEFIHNEVLDFIRENKDQPFFCYYAAVQPHADMIAPEAYMKKYRGKYLPESSYDAGYYIDQPEGHAAFVAMVNVLDDYVGEVMAELETQGISDNTIVIFASDNGPHGTGGHDPEYFDSNGLSRGFKRDLYEGGVRVPLLVQWPGKIEAGSVSDHISAFWDMMPTFAELIGSPLPETVQTDGLSMLPAWTGAGQQAQHEYLYWEFHERKGRVAIRKGDWKGVRYDVNIDPNSPLELYNLATDAGEQQNLAAQHPEIVKELDKLIRASHSPSPISKYNFPTSAKRKKK